MDPDHSKKHLKILASRINSLEKELEKALRNQKVLQDRRRSLEDGIQTSEANRIERIQALESKYSTDIDEFCKQIKLAEEVLERKKDERLAMIEYLISLDMVENSFGDLREFDWASLHRLTENIHKPSADVIDQYSKVEEMNEMIDATCKNLDEINEHISSTDIVRQRLRSTVENFLSHMSGWKKLYENQKKRIIKVQTDNEKLNLLLKQCVATNEPLSEYITRNVQQKCHSFLNCDPNSNELLDGLRKFKTRQDRIINLLRHQDAKLGSETNKLQVACDQTHDQLKFYTQLIEQHRNVILNRNRAHNAIQEQQTFNEDLPVSLPPHNSAKIQTNITDHYVACAQQKLSSNG